MSALSTIFGRAAIFVVSACALTGCVKLPLRLECPNRLTQGQDATILAYRVYSDVLFRWESGDGGEAAFIVDGQEKEEVVLGRYGPGPVEVTFRAIAPGRVRIIGKEVLVGPPIWIPPILTKAECDVIIDRDGD